MILMKGETMETKKKTILITATIEKKTIERKTILIVVLAGSVELVDCSGCSCCFFSRVRFSVLLNIAMLLKGRSNGDWIATCIQHSDSAEVSLRVTRVGPFAKLSPTIARFQYTGQPITGAGTSGIEG